MSLIDVPPTPQCSSLYFSFMVVSALMYYLHMLTATCVLFIHYRSARVNVFFMFTKVSNVFSVKHMPGGHTESKALAVEVAERRLSQNSQQRRENKMNM